jgi:hypothetical protein
MNGINNNKNTTANEDYQKRMGHIAAQGLAHDMEGNILGIKKDISDMYGQKETNDLEILDLGAKKEGIDRWFRPDDNGVTDWDKYYSSEMAAQQSNITNIKMNAASAANTANNQIAQYDRWLSNYGDMYAQQVQSKQASIDSLVANRQAHVNSANNEVAQYDRWLGNYGDMYAQQVQSKQAQTDALVASGKETYENFLNAIGYADAAAGASGRVGAGTSSAHVTKMLDQKLVDYVGEDRTLDERGGLFGSQLTAANMEMGQLKANLERQRMDVLGNKKTILDNLGITGWAYDSQMKAAGMEMQQLKTGLEMQKQNVLGDRNTTAANAANAQRAYADQLDAANKAMTVKDIYLGNEKDDMEKMSGVYQQGIDTRVKANDRFDAIIKESETTLEGWMGIYNDFTRMNGLPNIIGKGGGQTAAGLPPEGTFQWEVDPRAR